MTPDLVALADAVRDAHADYLRTCYCRTPMSESIDARARLGAAKQALRAAWMRAPKSARTEALHSASAHSVVSGDSPFGAVSSRKRLEDLINLPYPTETP